MSTLAERIEKVIGNGLAGLGLCDCGDPTCDDGRELAAHLAAEVAREVEVWLDEQEADVADMIFDEGQSQLVDASDWGRAKNGAYQVVRLLAERIGGGA